MLAKSKDTLSQKIAFFPLVDAEVVGASLEAKATVVDYRTGVAKMMQCFSKVGFRFRIVVVRPHLAVCFRVTSVFVLREVFMLTVLGHTLLFKIL